MTAAPRFRLGRPILALALLFSLILLSAGCGKKGELEPPPPKKEQERPVEPEGGGA